MFNVNILLIILSCKLFNIGLNVNILNISQSINSYLLSDFSYIVYKNYFSQNSTNLKPFLEQSKHQVIKKREKPPFKYQNGHNLINSLTENLNLADSNGLCLRSREEAVIRGRQCLRKCEKDADCISSKKRCLCDGLCGWSCVRPDLNCAELMSIKNGNFKISGNYFGAKVNYYCDKGYLMSGIKERTCQGDGSWSEQAPICRKKAKCLTPMTVAHARYMMDVEHLEFPINTTIQYSCFPGYEPKGFTKARCLFHNNTAQWFGPDLKCIPKSCDHPDDIENGHWVGNIFTFTNKVTYHCNKGYELHGPSSRFCQSNGNWSGHTPFCEPITCDSPPDLNNGKVYYTSTIFNSVVKYECNNGFKLIGFKTRICGSSKVWEKSEPKCIEVDCGWPGALHNGYLEGGQTTLGSVIRFKCFENTIFVGSSNSSICLENGNWSTPLPTCLSSCRVPKVKQGKVNNVFSNHFIYHGKKIEVTCEPRYELLNKSSSPICYNGTWSHIPKCVPAKCKKLPKKPKYGIVIVPRTDHNSKALFKCNDGFNLVGNNITQCYFGKWLHPSPVCEEIYCPFPGYIKNGRIFLLGHMGMYDYRPYVRKVTSFRQIIYDCDKGYFLNGPSRATCIGVKWKPETRPVCLKTFYPITSMPMVKRSLN